MSVVNRRQFFRRMLAVCAAGAALTVSGCGSGSLSTATVVSTVTSPDPPTVAPTVAPPLAPTVAPTVASPTGVPTQQAPAQPTREPLQPTQPTATGSKVLLAYFSRAGENYNYGGRIVLDVGNTEVVAGMISRLIGCDVHRIEPVNPYPEDYEATVAQNVREQNAGARPAIADRLASIARYDIVLLGSPIWNGRAPMIMSTFVEGLDFTGKTVFPFTTHAGSGLGTTVRDYIASCPGATIGEGLAVRGEEVRDAGAALESWLRSSKLLR